VAAVVAGDLEEGLQHQLNQLNRLHRLLIRAT
jgi:hypothetical protein